MLYEVITLQRKAAKAHHPDLVEPVPAAGPDGFGSEAWIRIRLSSPQGESAAF